MNNIIFWSGIWSPYYNDYTRPIGSYQLAHWLRKHKIGCQVIEFIQFMTSAQLIELTELSISNNTFAIALSTTFWPTDGKIPSSIREAIFYLKIKYPKLEIVGGGPRIQRYSKLLDKTFTGDAENTLLTYCQQKKYTLSFPTSQFNIVNLDHQFIEQDIILPNETLPIELGRGCIFKCKFCSYPNIGKKKHTYQRQQHLILDEMKWNYEQFGTTNYMFLDDTVNEDVDKINFLTTIKKEIGTLITWNGYLRADLIWSHKNHQQLLDSGLRNAYFGLESLHPPTAKLIGKAWNGTHAKDWIPTLYNDLWNKQVAIEGSFIVGLPDEPEESMIASAHWVNKLCAGTIFFLPFNLKNMDEEGAPESEFTRNYLDYGYSIDAQGKWSHRSGMTQARSIVLADELNQIVNPNWRIAGWRSATYYNAGLTVEQTKEVNLREGNSFLDSKKQDFTNLYISLYKKLIIS